MGIIFICFIIPGLPSPGRSAAARPRTTTGPHARHPPSHRMFKKIWFQLHWFIGITAGT
ncbi:conserved hypothetical protein, partial [Ricinus communis]